MYNIIFSSFQILLLKLHLRIKQQGIEILLTKLFLVTSRNLPKSGEGKKAHSQKIVSFLEVFFARY